MYLRDVVRISVLMGVDVLSLTEVANVGVVVLVSVKHEWFLKLISSNAISLR